MTHRGVLGQPPCIACGALVLVLPRAKRAKPPMTKPRRLRVIRRRHRYLMSMTAPLDADVLGNAFED